MLCFMDTLFCEPSIILMILKDGCPTLNLYFFHDSYFEFIISQLMYLITIIYSLPNVSIGIIIKEIEDYSIK